MPLTPESIEATWSNGGTVQIATPEDFNVFNSYLSTNYSSNTLRNAEITADLDFGDGTIPYTAINPPGYNYVTNLFLDGKGHSIKKIVEDNMSGKKAVFFYGGTNSTIKNVKIEKCNIAANNVSRIIHAENVENVLVDHCRWTVSNVSTFYGIVASNVKGYSSASTIFCTGNYYGAQITVSSERCAVLDTVYRTGDTSGGEARALYFSGGNHRLSFTRNRFFNFATVIGIQRFYANTSASTMYAAITAENATTISPLGGANSSKPTNSYYDNVLVPNAATYTDAGLSTSDLQSVATMTSKGFAVEEV